MIHSSWAKYKVRIQSSLKSQGTFSTLWNQPIWYKFLRRNILFECSIVLEEIPTLGNWWSKTLQKVFQWRKFKMERHLTKSSKNSLHRQRWIDCSHLPGAWSIWTTELWTLRSGKSLNFTVKSMVWEIQCQTLSGLFCSSNHTLRQWWSKTYFTTCTTCRMWTMQWTCRRTWVFSETNIWRNWKGIIGNWITRSGDGLRRSTHWWGWT